MIFILQALNDLKLDGLLSSHTSSVGTPSLSPSTSGLSSQQNSSKNTSKSLAKQKERHVELFII